MAGEFRNFVIYIEEGFSALSLSCVVGTLRNANSVLGVERYSWRLVSTKEGPVRSDCDIEVGSVDLVEVTERPLRVEKSGFLVLLSVPPDARDQKSWLRGSGIALPTAQVS